MSDGKTIVVLNLSFYKPYHLLGPDVIFPSLMIGGNNVEETRKRTTDIIVLETHHITKM